jgi:hypothetical protein
LTSTCDGISRLVWSTSHAAINVLVLNDTRLTRNAIPKRAGRVLRINMNKHYTSINMFAESIRRRSADGALRITFDLSVIGLHMLYGFRL